MRLVDYDAQPQAAIVGRQGLDALADHDQLGEHVHADFFFALQPVELDDRPAPHQLIDAQRIAITLADPAAVPACHPPEPGLDRAQEIAEHLRAVPTLAEDGLGRRNQIGQDRWTAGTRSLLVNDFQGLSYDGRQRPGPWEHGRKNHREQGFDVRVGGHTRLESQGVLPIGKDRLVADGHVPQCAP
ncbi:MAG TPA: hypothetical protein PKY77_19610 [Phycisphaerae bacterium]|nr:hypothetical protein [Phycisphaerae bacterium]HRY71467.1 hypothetical protein [Phycisphaerae bacterium]HSA30019.1 hypothetical protein [Phycisphaerae bacterium]